MKKRIICFILAMLIGVVSIPGYSYARDTYVTGGIQYKNFRDLTTKDASAIRDVISDKIGIMQGDEFGNFNPDKYLTKAEACAMVNRMVGVKNSYFYTSSKFKDVGPGHWANQIISQSVDLGYAIGDGNGYFYPDKTLNAMELITMCLRVIGIGEALDKTNNWPSAHMQFVNNERIISNYTLNVFDPITRLEAAKIVSQFLSANVWVRDARSGEPQRTDKTVLSKYFGAESFYDVLITDIDKTNGRIDGLYKDDYGDYTKELGDSYLPNDYDMTDYEIGSLVSLTKIGTNILKIQKDDEATNRIVYYDGVVDYDSHEGYLKLKVDGKTGKYNLNDTYLIVNANGETETGTYNNMAKAQRLIENTITYTKDDDDDNNNAEFDEVSGRIILNENNKVISITIEAYDKIMFVSKISGETISPVSSSVSNYHTVKDRTRTTSLNLSKVDYTIREADGTEVDIDDISKNDVLLISAEEPYSILHIDEKVYGTVKYVEYDEKEEDENELVDPEDRYVEIDGIKYYFNTKFADVKWSAESTCSLAKLKAKENKKINLYLDQNGKIVAWDY